ncbi:hypothetical protein [Blastococcus mobilis]|uniref:Uncharacterized protein n=1 Tax=Blastococcus mobilis TaxID=1938746 RepID=A0A238VYY2_9ACTN|nr:hypothetical protein [Blastococcus mobilis]SNR38679.1 hypothetical protein SAMN06272737_105111 [Blastococcus mobilis]
MASAKTAVEQVAQVGIEATAGVAAAATWRPRTTTIKIDGSYDIAEHRPGGSYYVASTYLNAESSSGSVTGAVNLTEQRRYLALAFGAPATAETAVGSGVYAHTFTMQPERPTWTVEYGDATHAARAAFVYATSYELEFGRNSGTSTFSMNLGGGQFTDGVALTSAGVEELADEIVPALRVSLYADTSLATLGSTKVDNALAVKFSVTDLRAGKQYLDAAKPSISKVVNTVPTVGFDLTVEADSAGRAWLQKLRDREVTYLRLEALGEGGHKLTIDAPVMVKEVPNREDEDNVYVAKYTLRIVKADDFELTATLVNGLED